MSTDFDQKRCSNAYLGLAAVAGGFLSVLWFGFRLIHPWRHHRLMHP